ncbi:MAG: calcium-binding protein, partial [Gammaproteobacteria bacterium]
MFGRGDGQDLIYDYDATPGNIDTVRLAPDVLPADLTVSRDARNLYLTINQSEDKLTLQYWFDQSANKIERVEFADGTVWDVATLIAKASIGTENADYIVGTGAAEEINGLGGNDK